MAQFNYDPTVFDQATLEGARRISVTAEFGRDTDDRWTTETPYLADLMRTELDLKPGQLVLDYGCGVGRVAKVLIERFGVRVLGVDSSERMRALAAEYVNHVNFAVVSRNMLQGFAGSGLRADAAIAVWVLQHCPQLRDDVRLIGGALRQGAGFAIVNNLQRVVPVIAPDERRLWADDGVDLRAVLNERFDPVREGKLDPEVVGAELAAASFWGTFRAR